MVLTYFSSLTYLRQKWINQVHRTGAGSRWSGSDSEVGGVLCGVHFQQSCFEPSSFSHAMGTEKKSLYVLKPDVALQYI